MQGVHNNIRVQQKEAVHNIDFEKDWIGRTIKTPHRETIFTESTKEVRLDAIKGWCHRPPKRQVTNLTRAATHHDVGVLLQVRSVNGLNLAGSFFTVGRHRESVSKTKTKWSPL
jgi:hypothetical protein